MRMSSSAARSKIRRWPITGCCCSSRRRSATGSSSAPRCWDRSTSHAISRPPSRRSRRAANRATRPGRATVPHPPPLPALAGPQSGNRLSAQTLKRRAEGTRSGEQTVTPHFALSGNSMKNLPKAGPGYSPMQNFEKMFCRISSGAMAPRPVMAPRWVMTWRISSLRRSVGRPWARPSRAWPSASRAAESAS